MSDSENERPAPKKAGKQAIEDIYQKKTQLEHILLRPDTYIGSVEPVSENMWVFDTAEDKLTQRNITIVPGLYKIFDEILVNAADNKQRDKKMDCIRININPEANEISVWNNGKGIPVEMHKTEKMYVPTMIFGHLLTSSNYNDEEEKVTGGRNGYGAKLCNIFSNKFTVETSCKESRKRFKQTWVENMAKVGNPKIGEAASEDFTKIVFQPDLKKFKMEKLDKDIVDLMSRRAYDVAASTGGVKVYLNDKRVPVKSFKDYVELMLKGHNDDIGNPVKVTYEKVSDRWEVACCISDSGFQQMSFVNSIATTKGGRHVDYITDMMVKQLADVIKKKNKGGVSVKPFQIKNHMWVFVNCLIVNPTFDSQTKENMTLQAKSFGSKCQLSDKFVNAVIKSGITEAVISWAKFKAQSQLEKVGGKKKTKLKGVPKLEDANEAGSKNAHRCTLILTEGDSAKSLAVSGLGVVGRDFYGVFPLRGKLLNVREASHKQILENIEINNVIKILGLQYKKKYNTPEDMKTLRYGKLMIMTDQDQDGSHIKGLLINFIHHNWPELLKQNFLEEFITPIVKATHKTTSQVVSFYSIPEYDEWRKTVDETRYNIKYYKGLGTSTSKEAKTYFEDMARHRIKFKYSGNQDDNSILMAFSKKCVDQRKEWLSNYMEENRRRREMDLPEVYLYEKDTKAINFSEFVNKELVLFSNADNERSIPNMMDGLKPGQRKVLFTCIKKNYKKEIKVAQLAGSVAELSAYHHGEASLMSTIINLAQNYVGSNNINLLMPNGQFGTRLQGGKDAASPRYIFTQLNPITKAAFSPHDTPLLHDQYEDNDKIEPMWYCPIIPMILVNGADGIGTGWMTKIPNYNPREIIDNLKKMIRGEKPSMMIPWYKGFKGHIEPVGNQRYVISGEVRVIDECTIEITELPIGVWTQNYKESVLEPMLYGNEKEKEKEKAAAKAKKKAGADDDDQPTKASKGGPVINDFKEYHTDTTVRFVVTMPEKTLEKLEQDGLHKAFKLQTTQTTTSMMAFDELGCMTKFEHVNEVLERYFKVRLDLYVKRKDYLLGMLRAEAKKLSNQARFIVEKCNGDITVENKKREVIKNELVARKYDSDPVKQWKRDSSKEEDEDEDEKEKKAKDRDRKEELEDGKDFDYILGMKMWALTEERKRALLAERDKKLKEVEDLESKTPEELWNDDLDNLLQVMKVQEAKEDEDRNYGKKAVKGARGKVLVAETMPSPNGRKIEPLIDSELRKKIEKAVQNKEKQTKKAIKTEEVDEFDAELGLDNGLSLQAVIKNSPQEIEKKLNAKKKEMKQTKLSFKPVKKEKATKEFDSTGSEGDDADSDSFDAVLSASPVKSRDAPRRAAASKAKFTFDDKSDEEMKSDSDFEVNHQLGDDSGASKRPVTISSDEDSDFGSSKKKAKVSTDLETSDALFDKLMGSSSPEKEERAAPPAKKPEPKKAPPKKFVDTESDSDMGEDDKPKTKAAAKKKASSDSDFGLEEEEKPKKKAPARKKVASGSEEEKPKKKRAPAKKKVAASDSEDDKPKKKKAPPKKRQPAMSDSEDEKPKKKAPPRKKLARPQSDSDDDMFSSKAKKGGAKKKAGSDDDSDFSASEVAPRERAGTGRARKPVSYLLDSGNDDSDF